MGSAFRKEVPDPRTHMTERERGVVTRTWKSFQGAHKDCGELIFLTMFSRHPDYLQLFRQFRGKIIDELPEDAQFRAHACAVGYQLCSMVDSVSDSVLLEALIRKNAISHLERQGVHPSTSRCSLPPQHRDRRWCLKKTGVAKSARRVDDVTPRRGSGRAHGPHEAEMVLVQESWRSFCDHYRDYGVLIFLSMLPSTRVPAHVLNFRGKTVA
ncbi:hypothetical protein HPB52_005672 [Rhipicephalus sanguineus]|uniref:Globin domain-containing protein n=1 Tax=Rhipicephalus sanguineus TaxID=34632 RepID=A0A9D4PUI0_RHISA|nr:hypothetical protein HPB52_005672 [Rhipicephalus sanguineus]